MENCPLPQNCESPPQAIWLPLADMHRFQKNNKMYDPENVYRNAPSNVVIN